MADVFEGFDLDEGFDSEGFNRQSEVMGGYKALAPGWYCVEVRPIEDYSHQAEHRDNPIGYRTNKNKTGYHLSVSFRVLGTHSNRVQETGTKNSGRVLFETYNLLHDSEEVKEKAKRRFKFFAKAAGLSGRMRGIRDLEGRKLMLRIGKNEDNPKENIIFGYGHWDGVLMDGETGPQLNQEVPSFVQGDQKSNGAPEAPMWKSQAPKTPSGGFDISF